MLGLARSLLLTVAAVAVTGCAQVKPWERGTLAKPAMSPADPGRQGRDAFTRHVFDIREGSTGGDGEAGGGCGCN
ncbi:DUF4266 domain-containing protein [Myxococcota bacterium]|nr:DUF4266 domain-containing protein [Myxococcota bacterium]